MKINFFNKKDNKNITFIFGCPRGGTTWLWSLLESHEDILPYVNEVKDKDGKYVTSESGIYIRKPRQAKRILIKFCYTNKTKRIIEKTPSHTLISQIILNDFPELKNIIILRNPVAVANSMIQSDMVAFESHDIDKCIKEIKRYYKALELLCMEPTQLCITYEQLLNNTELVLSKVFKYLDLTESNLQRIVKENIATTKVSVQGAFRSGKANSYLTELTELQRAKLNIELEKEIEFYNTQYERFENTCGD